MVTPLWKQCRSKYWEEQCITDHQDVRASDVNNGVSFVNESLKRTRNRGERTLNNLLSRN